jgi:dihydroneopterin aldolase
MKQVKRTVAINGLIIKAFHGLHAFEREEGNLFRLDIRVSQKVPLSSGEVRLEETLDYEQLLFISQEQMKKTTPLLETVAGRILSEILSRYAQVGEAEVSIQKLAPPLQAEVESSSVSLFFSEPEEDI